MVALSKYRQPIALPANPSSKDGPFKAPVRVLPDKGRLPEAVPLTLPVSGPTNPLESVKAPVRVPPERGNAPEGQPVILAALMLGARP